MDTLFGIVVLLVGFTTGWVLRGRRTGTPAAADDGLAYKLQQRDEELRAARAEVAVHTATLDTIRNEFAALTKKYEELANERKQPRQGRRRGGKERAAGKSAAAAKKQPRRRR